MSVPGPERPHARADWRAMLAVGVVATAIGIVIALLIPWFPTAASKQAHAIDTLWDVLLIASIPVFVLVTTVVGFSVWKFRMRPGEELLQLGSQPCLLVPLKLGENVLLGREMEVEGAAGHARLLGDDADVGGGHADPPELSDRSGVDALAGLLPLRVTPRPGALLRVLVGRHDVLTPERESDIDQLVRKLDGPSKAEAEAAAVG